MDVIEINVGGTPFATSRSTLINKEPGSMLARMFDGDLPPSHLDSQGRYFLDRDPKAFRYVMAYLRGQSHILAGLQPQAPEWLGVLEEARYFQLEGLEQLLLGSVPEAPRQLVGALSIKQASDTREWSRVLEGARAKNAKVIVDCWAKWCGPCKAIAPVFEALSKQCNGLMFVKVDVDNAEALAGELGMSAMPTFQVWSCESGSWRKVDELIGADEAKLADLAKKHSKQ